MAFRDAVLADSPLFYLECSETSGTVLADSSGHGNTGAIVGSATLNQAGMTSVTGKAIQFAGAGRIDVAALNGITLSGDYSIELVARWNNGTNSALFYLTNSAAAPEGPAVYWNSAQKEAPANALVFRSSFNSGYVAWYSSPLGDNSYRHCVFVRRGNVLEIWVSGVLASSLTLPSVVSVTTTMPASVMGNVFSQYASGAADEAAFYTTALTPTRIKYHAALAQNLAHVKGTAKLDTGIAASYVVVRDWATRLLIGQTVPATDGSFDLYVQNNKCDVTVFGPAGYQPITHGPIDPVPLV